jgi:hypothetical protein
MTERNQSAIDRAPARLEAALVTCGRGPVGANHQVSRGRSSLRVGGSGCMLLLHASSPQTETVRAAGEKVMAGSSVDHRWYPEPRSSTAIR